VKFRIFALITAGAFLVALGGTPATAAGKAPSGAARVTRPAALPKAPGVLLYDQTDDPNGVAITSQDFEGSFDAYDNQLGDDFVVPTGHKWIIKSIVAPGVDKIAGDLTTLVNVYIYKNSGSLPGGLKYQSNSLPATDDGLGNLTINAIPKLGNVSGKAALKAGHYWISVQARLDYDGNGDQWYWSTRNTQSNTASVWQNPGGGFGLGCTSWTTTTTCIPAGEGPDQLFSLSGKDKIVP